jgi:uncharacterized membrane protein YbhN (UPF0104 family)
MPGNGSASLVVRRLFAGESSVKPRNRTTRSGLRAIGNAIDVMAVASGHPEASPQSWGSVIVMMAIAMVGVAIWFGTFILSGVIVVVFGLGQGPYSSLGGAVALAGFFGGLAAAAIVMFRIIRRHRRLVAISGFGGEPGDEGDPSTPVATEVSRRAISSAELRDLDARLAKRKDGDSSRT